MRENRVLIPKRVYFRIGDVAEILGVKPYVIRFWETQFPFIAPEKSTSGQRVYRRAQIESLVLIKHLLHVERYSIEGAKKRLTELRRSSSLKEAMLSLVEHEGEEASEPPSQEVLKVGSKLDKIQVKGLREQITELQKLIREPQVNGKRVPGLMELKLNSKTHSKPQLKRIR